MERCLSTGGAPRESSSGFAARELTSGHRGPELAETRAAQAQLGNVLVPKRRGGAVGGLVVASGVMRQDTAICCARVSGGAAVSSRATDAAVLCFGLVLAHPRD